ncbi:probable low-specificity L-threonine aldolase 2 isoform X4 [Panthera tigris]|uniref:probable low-specificity L-threonine aldolase 2 isoform X4 n=1 Tax=Panthera tigris TaxID=9694 RepID=UPI001C6F7D79|nr:probable low-specificity L-threonine aldolase 2 isoform X4 [Panthera tigris]
MAQEEAGCRGFSEGPLDPDMRSPRPQTVQLADQGSCLAWPLTSSRHGLTVMSDARRLPLLMNPPRTPSLSSSELQEKAATLLGVDRTLFVPTNTMANLISVMCHCQRRGSQLLLGQESHLHVYEQGGVAQIAGVHSHPLPDLPHGTLDLLELERMVTRGLGSPYHPVCELICLENTHSSSGGRVLPIDYLRQGLGAPVGALVGGPKDFIEGAWRLRKALGGGMRQAGVLAAAALVGLADVEEVLLRDHQNARRFAQGLQELASPICSVDLAAVETNMVMVTVDGLPPQELCWRLQAVSADEVAQTGRAVRVLLFPWTGRSVRAVWHRDVSARDTELALRKWGKPGAPPVSGTGTGTGRHGCR